MFINNEELKSIEEDIKGFLKESADWEIEKILSMSLVYQMAMFSSLSEQNKKITELLEAIQKKE